MKYQMQKFLLNQVLDTSVKAGEFIRQRVGKIRHLSFKSSINLVTDIDKDSQSLIIKNLKKILPEADFLAEEEKKHHNRPYKQFRWIIDPLDGTTNFVHGFPFFCVSIALQENADIILASVYDPLRKELFYAIKDKGSFLNKNRIYVSKTKKLKKSMVATGFSYKFDHSNDNNIANFVKFLLSSQAVRRAGSAALDLCYVACGRFDGFWELDLNPWDTAGGMLIVREAGGKVTNFKGIEYSFNDKQILAANSLIHRQMRILLNRDKEIFLKFI